jgi:hypothetical protein
LRIVQTPFFRASTAGQSFFLQFRAERAVQNNNFFRQKTFYFANCNHKILPENKLLFNSALYTTFEARSVIFLGKNKREKDASASRA